MVIAACTCDSYYRDTSAASLVGNGTVLDSLGMTRRGGRVCEAGFLGGLGPIKDFNPLLQMPSGVHFSFFGSFMFGTKEFQLSEIPFQKIVDRAAGGAYKAKPAEVFRFLEIQDARGDVRTAVLRISFITTGICR